MQVADTSGSIPITLSANWGLVDWNLFLIKFSKQGKLLSAYNHDGIVSGTAAGPFNCSSGFSKNASWKIAWLDQIGTLRIQQFSSQLTATPDVQVTIPYCPTATSLALYTSEFSQTAATTYNTIWCNPVNAYKTDSANNLVEKYIVPYAGSFANNIITPSLSIDASESLYSLSSIVGSIQYRDSFGTHTLSSNQGATDIVVAKFHQCHHQSVSIVLSNGSLVCNSPGASYQWYIDTFAIASATSSIYVPSQPGNYSVMVSDTWGCSDTSNSITVVPTATGNVSQPGSIVLFPNPFEDDLAIKGLKTKSPIQICDLSGRVLFRGMCDEKDHLKLNYLSSGIYFLKVDAVAYKIIKR